MRFGGEKTDSWIPGGLPEALRRLLGIKKGFCEGDEFQSVRRHRPRCSPSRPLPGPCLLPDEPGRHRPTGLSTPLCVLTVNFFDLLALPPRRCSVASWTPLRPTSTRTASLRPRGAPLPGRGPCLPSCYLRQNGSWPSETFTGDLDKCRPIL